MIRQRGLSLLEMMVACVIMALVMAGLYGIVGNALNAERDGVQRNDTLQQARFAMQQMVNAVRKSPRLLLPLGENPATAWSESVRNVLAVTLDSTLDRNSDGWADGNNDKDYLDVGNNGYKNSSDPERVDEDVPNDNSNDNMPGIIGIDDDNDGNIDDSGSGLAGDDDEDGKVDEDGLNGIDDDGDGAVDEDLRRDMNQDTSPGVQAVDDDLDGTVDEGGSSAQGDDDEDTLEDEDPYDPVVFYLTGTTLQMRIPNINPSSGADFTTYPLAENVSVFRVERLIGGDGKTVLVDITLTLSPPNGESVSLNTRLRVGSGL